MTAVPSAEDSTRFVPDSLYNVFAYLSTGILFFTLFFSLFLDPTKILAIWKSLEVAGQIATVPIILSAVYIYSEFISVMSYHVIRKPVGYLVKLRQPRAIRDFGFDYKELLSRFPLLQHLTEKQRGNYWTLIYWAKINHPPIGNDLLERHARVKMARMNALNSLILFSLSLLYLLFRPQFMANAVIARNGGQWVVFAGAAVATVLFAFEFYQRQCWFADIVVKIFASLSKQEEAQNQ